MPILELEVRCDDDVRVFTFAEFPVRIGRDEENEMYLGYEFVSRWHARIERDEEDRLFLIDAGSRHGVTYGDRQLEPEERAPLSDGAEFMIDAALVRVRFIEGTLPATFREPTNDNATSLYEREQLVPEVIQRVSVLMEEYRAARGAALAAISMSIADLPPEQHAPMLGHLSDTYSELAFDPQFLAIAPYEARPSPAATEAPGSPEATSDSTDETEQRTGYEAETIALRCVQKLAAAYVSDAPPLTEPASVARFAVRLHQTLSAFLSATAEIRFAFDCETAGASLSRVDDHAAMLGRELLDWRADGNDAFRALERGFIDVVTHHAALISEVESAVRDILGVLSPAAIEWASRASRWHGPFWTRTLWRELVRRHEAVAASIEERLGRRFFRVQAALRGGSRPAQITSGAGAERMQGDGADDANVAGIHWPFDAAAAWE